MRYSKFSLIDHKIIIKEYVNINNAVSIAAIDTFMSASHGAFDRLSNTKQLIRSMRRINRNNCIEEGIFGAEPPRLALYKGRSGEYSTRLFVYQTDSLMQIGSFITTKIGTQAQIRCHISLLI